MWDGVGRLDCGEIVSYEELAARIGFPKATRAVGTALKINPVLIFVPCHRVIKKSGDAGHYAGGEDIKKRLLILEKKSCATLEVKISKTGCMAR